MKLDVKEIRGNESLFTVILLQLVPLVLFTTSIYAMPQASAAAPVITSPSTIANGVFNPAPIIVGVGFATDVGCNESVI